jgi:hypothetical protein
MRLPAEVTTPLLPYSYVYIPVELTPSTETLLPDVNA